MWLHDIEDGAMEQARNLANLPFAFHHIALMPDTHQGFGMPIGGVLATKDAIIPNAVGVDIGCGMGAVRTSLTGLTKKSLEKAVGIIRKMVPLGSSWHKSMRAETLMPQHWSEHAGLYGDLSHMQVVPAEYEAARKQLGTLGSGNHFLEIQKGLDRQIWLMVHSGSRNIGKKVADYYNQKARKLASKLPHQVPANWQLAYLPSNSEEAQQYLTEMQYCLDFAFASRREMMNRLMEVVREISKGRVSFDPPVNIAHNYTALEPHFGEEVYVHRKGATSAKEGERGIIPGSQGANSYIVEGRGNPESFMSCSHGAGRVMGRRQAIRKLSLEKEIQAMNRKGIVHGMHSPKDLDEAASAYKDISKVMRNQKDLVKILNELQPLAVVKG